MILLTVRTDKPEAEIGIFDDEKQIAYEVWEAHRQLAETIHQKIRTLLESNNLALTQVRGIVCFEGPGSFTGLRIGLTVANALSYGLQIPIVASGGENWIKNGVQSIKEGKNDIQALPFYGADAHITPQKK